MERCSAGNGIADQTLMELGWIGLADNDVADPVTGAPRLVGTSTSAGRMFSRAAAPRTFTHDQSRSAMHAFLDEIPAAYKDIGQVIADASALVKVRRVLRQIVNVKGD